ncbi:MAG: type II toxin-antitoxin system HicA family toxin [Deltaproteobacteria bacterium]|nr:type II toxin-antitoxin system HicA family toxin [Deltaproteobacteria bacterium]
MTSPELRGVSARELIRALEADGFSWTRGRGSHRVYRHSDGRRVVLAFHRPSATFPPKTLAAILAGTGWTDDDLRRLQLIS